MRAATCIAALALTACDDRAFERMVHQPRCRTYGPCEWFDDGMALREPPPGALPTSAPSDDRAAALSVVIPVDVTHSLMARGQNRFQLFCATCHGPLGDGHSEVARNMVLRPPPSLQDPAIVGMSPGAVYRVITEGYGLMRPYSIELPPQDRWAVVAYLRALQLSQSARLDELPEPLRQEAAPWLN